MLEKGPDEFSDVIVISGNFGLNARSCYIPVTEINLKALEKLDPRVTEWITQTQEQVPMNPDKPDKLYFCINEYDFLNQIISNFQQDILLNIVLDEMDNKHPVTFGDCFNKNR